MISNDIDIEHWRRQLAANGRVQIPDFLQPAAADRLATCLEAEVPWQVATREGGESHTSGRGVPIDDAAYAALLERNQREAATDYRFAYDSYMLVRAAKEGWDPDLLVHRVLDFFNTPEFIAFAQYLSGDATISHANLQCTRYRPGQFLLPHDDFDAKEGRRFAYIVNLTRTWRADWGGQLQFLDGAGNVVDTLLPRWNSLSLMRVPQRHQVTLVSPWAGAPRLAMTGWWLQLPR